MARQELYVFYFSLFTRSAKSSMILSIPATILTPFSLRIITIHLKFEIIERENNGPSHSSELVDVADRLIKASVRKAVMRKNSRRTAKCSVTECAPAFVQRCGHRLYMQMEE